MKIKKALLSLFLGTALLASLSMSAAVSDPPSETANVSATVTTIDSPSVSSVASPSVTAEVTTIESPSVSSEVTPIESAEEVTPIESTAVMPVETPIVDEKLTNEYYADMTLVSTYEYDDDYGKHYIGKCYVDENGTNYTAIYCPQISDQPISCGGSTAPCGQAYNGEFIITATAEQILANQPCHN